MFGGGDSMNAVGTRAELRAAVTRGFYEQQRAKLNPGAPRMILPWQIAPMAKGRIATVLSAEIDEPATNAARSASLAGLCHRKTHGLLPALLGKGIADERTDTTLARCPCCVARQRSGGTEARVVDRIDTHETTVSFDADDLLTTVTTRVRVAARWFAWDEFLESCDPANWNLAGEFFRRSDPIARSARPDGQAGWVGRLHEVFEWAWNESSEAMFDNELNIDFSHGVNEKKGFAFVCSHYDLYRSNASKLWTARESGGLDVDGGYMHAKLTSEWLDVTASKQIRFTDPELGPPGLGAMLNYLAPTTAGIWMHKAVQAGVERCIHSEPVRQRFAA
jgi:hypothetical protein